MGNIQPVFTDQPSICGILPASFLKMFASCLVVYDGHVYVNMIVATDDCEELTPFWTCANNGLDPEEAIIANAFALDSCGNLGMKVFAEGVNRD